MDTLARQCDELAHEVRRLRWILTYSVLRHGGHLVMDGEGVDEAAMHGLCLEPRPDGGWECKTTPRYPSVKQ